MDWLGIVLIALITGAIFFVAGWIFATWIFEGKYIQHKVSTERPSYFPESYMHELIKSGVIIKLLQEGAMKHIDDGEYKSRTVTFYLKEEDDEGL